MEAQPVAFVGRLHSQEVDAQESWMLTAEKYPTRKQRLMQYQKSITCEAGVTCEFDRCRYGLTSPQGKPVKKPTRFMTNMPAIVDEFGGKKCTCTVPHDLCEGSIYGIKVSRYCQKYPPAMCNALASSCARHLGLQSA